MKQNAVGLASIAILATGVLVMISTTVSLYAGGGGDSEAELPPRIIISPRGICSGATRAGCCTRRICPWETLLRAVEQGRKKRPDHKGDGLPGVSDGLL